MVTESNQTEPAITYVGVDVSKNELDIHAEGRTIQVKNQPSGFKELLRWLEKENLPNIQVVCEATGGYEQALVHAMRDAGITTCIVMPARVRAFANAIGLQAKTDPIDAQLIVRYAEATKPRALSECDQTQKALALLIDFRQQLLDQIKTLKNQAEHLGNAATAAISKRLLLNYEKELKRLEKDIDALLEKSGALSEHYKALLKVQGIGRYTALSVLAYLPEIGTLSRKRVAALAGLAPYNHDSGTKKGYRSIRGGRTKLRRGLYMAALTASRSNPVLSVFYERLKKQGKPSKVALTAVMRKLVILCNELIKNPQLSLA